jgi:hypothetical protein
MRAKLLAWCMTICLASVAFAAQAQEPGGWALIGKIVSVDPSARVFEVVEADGSAETLVVGDHTTIMSGDKIIDLEGLKTGDQVVANGDVRGGRKVATYISVVGN